MTDATVRAQLLNNLAEKAGYKVGHVDPTVHPSGRLVAELLHDGDADTANLVAAWYGLLAREHRVLAFHEGQGGPDVLHTWVSGVRPQNLLASGKHLPHIAVTPKGRVYAFDQGKRSTSPILQFAAATRAQDHVALQGTGQYLGAGSGPDSAARSSYRTTIQRYSDA